MEGEGLAIILGIVVGVGVLTFISNQRAAEKDRRFEEAEARRRKQEEARRRADEERRKDADRQQHIISEFLLETQSRMPSTLQLKPLLLELVFPPTKTQLYTWLRAH